MPSPVNQMSNATGSSDLSVVDAQGLRELVTQLEELAIEQTETDDTWPSN